MGRINFGSKLILVYAIAFLFASHVVSDANVPVMISRRQSGDIIYGSTSHFSCNKDNSTFLVSDRRCVKNQHLISACSFSISPIMEFSTFRVAIQFGHYQHNTDLEHTAVTSMSNNSLTTAVVVATNYIKQPVNGSLCQITSLEVYRGRRNITRISHDGFFLSDEGIFKIDRNKLAYNIDEYKGELYRMNISCTAERSLRSGCLFFKVTGITQVTNAKFNHLVQGTVDNNITSEPTTAMTTPTMTSQVSTTSPMRDTTTLTADSKIDTPLTNGTDGSGLMTTTAGSVTTIKKTNKINNLGVQVGSFQYYMLVVAGSGVAFVVLTAIVILMTYLTISLRNKKFKFSLEVVRIPRLRQRSRNLTNNIHIEEKTSADISILPESDVELTPVESSSLEPPTLSPPSESDADYEVVQEADRDKSLPPRKCDRIPVYIFLGPRESDPPIPKSPIECKQNLAYLHLGPEDNSTAASLQHKPITCKKNAAYIHLDPEGTSV